MSTVASPDLSTLGRGLADPVHGAQTLFRTLLTAMSYPGRVQTLPVAALAGLEAPAGLPSGLCALLLTVLDRESSLHLHPALGGTAALDYLRFHTGVPTWAGVGRSAFVGVLASDATARLWSELNPGSDERPQDGATLVVEVPSLLEGGGPADCTLHLNGPGIRRQARLSVAGLDRAFWQARIDLQARFPQGIDLLLCCGTQVVALPRSTHLALEG